MSETPHHPEWSDPTQRFDAGTPTPAPSDPTAPISGAHPSEAGRPDAGGPTEVIRPAEPAGTTQPTYPVAPPPFQYPSETPPTVSGPPYPAYPANVPATQPAYGAPPPGYGYPPGYQQPGYPAYDAYGRPLSDKSKIVAGVLGIALGGLGVGRFYTGHVGLGVAQLLVSVFTCGIGHIWGLIDGIMILANGGTDAQGRVLRD